MKILTFLALLICTLAFAQGVKQQFGTTNTGPVLTNIVRSIATNVGGGVAMNAGFGTNITIVGLIKGTNTTGIISNVFDASNVKFWGARGDGVTDDTSAFQSTANYLFLKEGNPGIMFIPAGGYVLNSTVFVTNQLVIVGLGQPTINYHGNDYAFRMGNPSLSSPYNGNFEVNGCNFYGYGSALGLIFFERWNQGTTVRNCRFPFNSTPASSANFTSIVFDGDNFEPLVTGCEWNQNYDGHAIDVNRSSAVNSTPIRLLNNYFGGIATNYCVRINGAAAQIIGNVFTAHNPSLLIIGGSDGSKSHSAMIVGNQMEAFTNSIIQYSGMLKGAQIHNNYANVNTAGGASNYFVAPINTDTSNSVVGCEITGNSVFDASNGVVQATAATGQIGNSAWPNTVYAVDGTVKTNFVSSNSPLLFRENTPWSEMQDNTTNSFKVLNGAALMGGFGSGSLPLYAFQNDPTTGMFLVSGSELGFATGGSGVVRLNTTGMRIGNLVSPVAVLDVSGDIRAGTTVTASTSSIATNSFQLPTNYVAASFAPVAGMVKICSSNGVLWKVTQLTTNLLSANVP